MSSYIKRIIFVVIIVLISLGVFFTIKNTKHYDSLSILSLRKEYNKVISDSDETIQIPLYFSQKNNFLINKKNLSYSTLKGDDIEMKIDVKEVEYANEEIVNQKTYYLYLFKISIPFDFEKVEKMYFKNACLNLTYQNNASFLFLVGNINIFFSKANTYKYLRLTKMSGVYNEIESNEYLVGLNIQISSPVEVMVKNITLNNPNYDLATKYAKKTSVPYKYSLLNLYENYNYHIDGEYKETINVHDEIELFIPITFNDEIHYLDSLPIYFEFEYQGNNYLYIVDDFKLINKGYIEGSDGVMYYEYKY